MTQSHFFLIGVSRREMVLFLQSRGLFLQKTSGGLSSGDLHPWSWFLRLYSFLYRSTTVDSGTDVMRSFWRHVTDTWFHPHPFHQKGRLRRVHLQTISGYQSELPSVYPKVRHSSQESLLTSTDTNYGLI